MQGPTSIRALILLAVALPMLARPAGGRWFMECVDGTPCWVLASAAVREVEPTPLPAPEAPAAKGCCPSTPMTPPPAARPTCHDDPSVPPPPEQECVVRGAPPVAFVIERIGVDLGALPLVALAPPVAHLLPVPQAVATIRVADEIPPLGLDPKQGVGARAPPAFHV